jgi:tRNA U54 and U55 pseudouridine synthase Pus10
MIMISYVRPNIVISADYLIYGKVILFDSNKSIYCQDIYNKQSINIPFNNKLHKTIKIKLITTKETITKTINL